MGILWSYGKLEMMKVSVWVKLEFGNLSRLREECDLDLN